MLADKSKNSQQILHDTLIKEKQEKIPLEERGTSFFLGGGGREMMCQLYSSYKVLPKSEVYKS